MLLHRWIQGLDGNGRGSIISVNSYGPGAAFWPWDPEYMGGPKLHDNSAQCLFNFAKNVGMHQADRGIIVNWNSGNCEASTYVNSVGTSGTFAAGTPPPTPRPTNRPTPRVSSRFYYFY